MSQCGIRGIPTPPLTELDNHLLGLRATTYRPIYRTEEPTDPGQHKPPGYKKETPLLSCRANEFRKRMFKPGPFLLLYTILSFNLGGSSSSALLLGDEIKVNGIPRWLSQKEGVNPSSVEMSRK